MRVLVTGHNGYIGSVLVPALRVAGHDVTGLDTFFFEDSTIGPDWGSIPAYREDLRDVEVSDLGDFDAVIHLAALSHDPLGDIPAERTEDINHQAAVRLARSARDAGVGRFVLASSSSVYGLGGEDLLTEDAPVRPTTPYAVSKARAEEAIAQLADRDFSPCFLRAPIVYGVSARLRTDTLLNNLVCWAHTARRVQISGNPRAWRPMVHVQDVAAVFAAALGAPREALHGHALNVGAYGENYQLAEVAAIVREAVPGCSVEPAAGSEPDPGNCRLDFSKLSRTFPAFKPHWNALFGAKDLYAALQESGVSLEDLQGRKYIRLAQLSTSWPPSVWTTSCAGSPLRSRGCAVEAALVKVSDLTRPADLDARREGRRKT
jgi:nucleoside-diphosphate-sugar epimerase